MSNNDVIRIVPPAPIILDLEPTELVERAFKIAESLALLVRAGQMVCRINGEEFVKVDGWIAMGSLLGLSPHVTDVHELPDGSFEAAVEIRARSGAVYAAASARCGMDEKRWSAVPAFSRRSMAITRAIGKAYRISFSWVMRLAGMSATPAEDMPQYTPEPQKPAQSAANRDENTVYDPFTKTLKKKQAVNETKNGQWNGQWPGR